MLKSSLSEKIRVRNCKESDYRFVYRLTKRNMEGYVKKFWGGWNSAMFRKNFRTKNINIVEYGKKKIGFYDIEKQDKYLYVHNVQLTRSSQGKGVGSYIMCFIEKGVSNSKFPKIRLSVFKDNPAKEFYLFLGYKVLEDKGASVIMEKRVKQ